MTTVKAGRFKGRCSLSVRPPIEPLFRKAEHHAGVIRQTGEESHRGALTSSFEYGIVSPSTASPTLAAATYVTVSTITSACASAYSRSEGSSGWSFSLGTMHDQNLATHDRA